MLLDHFWDVQHGGVFTTPDDGERLVVRQKDLFDNATASANSTATMALLRLSALTGEGRHGQHADRILALLGTVIPQSPSGFANALAALAIRHAGVTEVVLTGERPDLLAAVRGRWLPDAVLAWGEPYDSPLWAGRTAGHAFVCRNHVCQLPTDDVAELLRQLA